ncbi:hypothetical protein LTR53_004615 [Teratosphaeriaceae sp. CCFEE 6253]|nr:hypothetical protein LTR53_004615 [Teratosphaeriaceae sp. CCFEE 6253]
MRALALAESTDSDEPEASPIKIRKRKALKRKRKSAPAEVRAQDAAGDGSQAPGSANRNVSFKGRIDGALSNLPVPLWQIEAKQLDATWVPADTRELLESKQKSATQYATRTSKRPQRSSSARSAMPSLDSVPAPKFISLLQSSPSLKTPIGGLRVVEDCLTVSRMKDIAKEKKERPSMSVAAPAETSRSLTEREQLASWDQGQQQEAERTVSVKLSFRGRILIEFRLPQRYLRATANPPGAESDPDAAASRGGTRPNGEVSSSAAAGFMAKILRIEKASLTRTQDRSTRGISAMRSTIELYSPPATVPEPAYYKEPAATSELPLSLDSVQPDLVCLDPATLDAAQTMVSMAGGADPSIRPMPTSPAGTAQSDTPISDAGLHRAREIP